MESKYTQERPYKVDSRIQSRPQSLSSVTDHDEPTTTTSNTMIKGAGSRELVMIVRSKPKEGTTLEKNATIVSEKFDDPILKDYVQKNPELQEILNGTFKAVKGLEDCLLSDTLLPTETSEGVGPHGALLVEMFFKREDDHFRSKLGDFVTALGLPKITHDIFVTLRSRFPEVTTWDREIVDEDEVDDHINTWRREMDERLYRPATYDYRREEKQKEKVVDDKKELEAAQDCLAGDLGCTLLNFADRRDDDFCVACGDAGLVTLLVEMSNEAKTCISNMAKDDIPDDEGREGMLNNFIGILCNLSRSTACRVYFTNCHAVDIIAPFLKAEVTFFATHTLLMLAYLIDEKNNELIMSDEEPIALLIEILQMSLDDADHEFMGFSTLELAEGLGKIASNDCNKKQIGRNDAIPLLVKMIQEAIKEEEEYVAVETLWILSFDRGNNRTIREDDDAMSVLHELEQSQNSRARKAAAGVLWELQGKEVHSEGTLKTDSSQHIMISYQWDVQDVVIEIRNKLQSLGFKVWLDVDEMGGSTLESMAKAVENAAVVLMCVSQKYKDSPNCRSEAEYTFQLRRNVVPLMMEKNYTPDGWLGMIVGAKLWIDFREKHKMRSSLKKLVKELKDKGSGKVQEQPIQVTSADVVDATPNRPDIGRWTLADVAKWLADLGLKKVSNKAKKRMNGTLLIRLNNLRKESPEFFYTSLQRDFNLSNVFDVLLFTDALDQLVG